MPFCNNCGYKLADNAKFCPYCGAVHGPDAVRNGFYPADDLDDASPTVRETAQPTGRQYTYPPSREPVHPPAQGQQTLPPQEPETRPPRRRERVKAPRSKKKKLIIAGSAVGGVLLILAVCALIIFNSPAMLVARALSNTAEDIGSTGLVSTLVGITEGSNVVLSTDMSKWKGSESNACISLSFRADLAETEGEVKLDITDGGRSVLGAEVYVSPDAAVLMCDRLADGAYGVDLENAAENLPDSPFDPDSDSSYALPEGLYGRILDWLDSDGDEYGEVYSELKELITDYLSEALEQIIDCSETDRHGDSVRVGGEEINTTAVVLSAEGRDLAEALDSVWKEFKDDEDAREVLEALALALSVSGEIDAEDTDEFVDKLYDRLGDLLDDLSYELKELDAEFVITFQIAKSGKTLAALDLAAVGEDGERASAGIIIGKSVKETSEIKLYTSDEDGDEDYIKLITGKNSDRAYECRCVTGDSYGDEDTVFSFEWDKSSGEFTLVFDERNNGTVSGTLEYGNDSTSLVISKVSYFVFGLKGDIKIDIGGSSKSGSAPDYTDIVTMSEDELDALMNELEDNIGNLEDDSEGIINELDSIVELFDRIF